MAESAALRRRLTAELRRLRNQTGLSQRQMTDKLDWSPWEVIRIEQGAVRTRMTDLAAVLNLYGVPNPVIVEDLATMVRGPETLPRSEYRDVLPAEATCFLRCEVTASLIRQFALEVAPGLLQSEERSRAPPRVPQDAPRPSGRCAESSFLASLPQPNIFQHSDFLSTGNSWEVNCGYQEPSKS